MSSSNFFKKLIEYGNDAKQCRSQRADILAIVKRLRQPHRQAEIALYP